MHPPPGNSAWSMPGEGLSILTYYLNCRRLVLAVHLHHGGTTGSDHTELLVAGQVEIDGNRLAGRF